MHRGLPWSALKRSRTEARAYKIACLHTRASIALSKRFRSSRSEGGSRPLTLATAGNSCSWTLLQQEGAAGLCKGHVVTNRIRRLGGGLANIGVLDPRSE
eukprot:scaffold2424_cov407-Prasinococcus_capsulatus_cf.AAC.1